MLCFMTSPIGSFREGPPLDVGRRKLQVSDILPHPVLGYRSIGCSLAQWQSMKQATAL